MGLLILSNKFPTLLSCLAVFAFHILYYSHMLSIIYRMFTSLFLFFVQTCSVDKVWLLTIASI